MSASAVSLPVDELRGYLRVRQPFESALKLRWFDSWRYRLDRVE
jgi:hypothetical protein